MHMPPLNHGCAIHHVSVSICYCDRNMYVYNPCKLIVNRENMDVIKPLDLTPLFERAPHGPPVKLAIQRHCSTTPPISLNGRLSTPIDPLTLLAVIVVDL